MSDSERRDGTPEGLAQEQDAMINNGDDQGQQNTSADPNGVDKLVSTFIASESHFKVRHPDLTTAIIDLHTQAEALTDNLHVISDVITSMPQSQTKKALRTALRSCNINLTQQVQTVEGCSKMVQEMSKIVNLVFELFKSMHAFQQRDSKEISLMRTQNAELSIRLDAQATLIQEFRQLLKRGYTHPRLASMEWRTSKWRTQTLHWQNTSFKQ